MCRRAAMNLHTCIAPILTAILVAGCAADTSEDDATEDDGTTDVTEALGSFNGFFRSPSGKNYCWVGNIQGENIARCEWRGGGDHAVELDGTKPGHKIHVTDTVYSNSYTLQY